MDREVRILRAHNDATAIYTPLPCQSTVDSSRTARSAQGIAYGETCIGLV